MKIIEFLVRIMKITKKSRVLQQNHENHKKHMIPNENHANHENLRIPLENQEKSLKSYNSK